MRRLTTREWGLVNDALAYYEAAVEGGDLSLTEADQAKLEDGLEVLRGKVFERMPDDA